MSKIQPPNQPEPARKLAVNAARIGFSFDHERDLTPAHVEEVVAAATALSEIEAKRGFTWEDRPADWETVCARIADTVEAGRPQNWHRHIRVLMGKRRQRGAT
jgi:hypothetical protein